MKKPVGRLATCLLLTFVLSLSGSGASQSRPPTVCIIGSGIGGSSVAYHLRRYGVDSIGQIRMFERRGKVGGRMATVSIGGKTFEAGASILHPKNYHAVDFAKSLNLTVKKPSASGSTTLGIWNGGDFIFKTLRSNSKFWMVREFVSLVNSMRMFLRYGVSLLRMSNFVERTVDKFVKYYEALDCRPVFESVEEMLKWSGLYDLTTRSLEDELLQLGFSPRLIRELVTVITRINYGQSVEISGLAGAVSLAGSGGGLWAIEGGNWQLAAGLINQSNVALHLNEEIKSISKNAGFYELNSTSGQSYTCEVAVIATPLDELDIQFKPSISIPERKMQHTFTTFVKGCLNPKYFGLNRVSDIPDLIGTTETCSVPFSSIGTLWKQSEKDMTYKVFSRHPMSEELLDQIFSVRDKTIRINWAAYPQYHAPERFAPFILDHGHLYYVNAFENAASTIETSAVSAENVARLILSRLSQHPVPFVSDVKYLDNIEYELRSDL